PQVPDDKGLNGVEMALGMHAQALADTKTQQEISTSKATEKKDLAQATEAEANTKKTNLELQWGGSPQMQESRYRFVLGQMARGQKPNADDMAAAVAYEASQAKTTSTSDSLGVMSTNSSKPSGLAQFQKGGGGGGGKAQNAENSIVDMIGNYQADPQLLSRMFFKHPEILGLIRQKYPDFDQTTYTAKNK